MEVLLRFGLYDPEASNCLTVNFNFQGHAGFKVEWEGRGGGRQGRDRVIECGNQEELWNNCDAKRDIFEEAGNICIYFLVQN